METHALVFEVCATRCGSRYDGALAVEAEDSSYVPRQSGCIRSFLCQKDPLSASSLTTRIVGILRTAPGSVNRRSTQRAFPCCAGPFLGSAEWKCSVYFLAFVQRSV